LVDAAGARETEEFVSRHQKPVEEVQPGPTHPEQAPASVSAFPTPPTSVSPSVDSVPSPSSSSPKSTSAADFMDEESTVIRGTKKRKHVIEEDMSGVDKSEADQSGISGREEG
jgi:hypothetical protein